MESVLLWMKNEFYSHINIDSLDGSHEFKNLIKNSNTFPLNRQLTFINLKYILQMKNSGYTYMTFSTENIIYAVVYFYKEIPEFLCLSPTFLSSKGEFRDGFIKFKEFELAYEKYNSVLSIIEEKINKNKLDITYALYPNNEKIKDIDLLSIRLLVCSIYLILYKKENNQLQIHTDNMYVNIIKNINIDTNILSEDIYNYLFNGKLERPFGQKLIPLSVGEAIKINNILYPAWRELFISYSTCDMVLNGISPTFAIAANWTYIEDVDTQTFDNKIIKNKYNQNNEVIEIINNLKTLYESSENIDNIESAREKIFKTLSNLSSNKLLSNLAISRIDEFVNLTFGSIPSTIKLSKVIHPKYKKFLNDITFFDKFIFDLMYGCHVLHKKIGVIHFDLHLNNMTILDADNSFYKLKDNEYIYNKSKKYHTLFIIEGQKDSYLFPFEGNYGTLIDFSDSILNKKFLNFTDKFIRFSNFEDIIDKEKEIIFERLSRILNYVAKNKDKVKGAIISKYEDMFKALTAIDYVYITRNIRLMLENDINKELVSTKIIDRAKYMENQSLEYLLASVQNVVDYENKNIEYVGDILIPRFFEKYSYQHKPNIVNIYETYNFKNDWKYYSIDYDKYPDWAKKDLVEKKYGKNITNELFGKRNINLDVDRDIHLAFLVEKLSAEYGTNIIQTSTL